MQWNDGLCVGGSIVTASSWSQSRKPEKKLNFIFIFFIKGKRCREPAGTEAVRECLEPISRCCRQSSSWMWWKWRAPYSGEVVAPGPASVQCRRRRPSSPSATIRVPVGQHSAAGPANRVERCAPTCSEEDPSTKITDRSSCRAHVSMADGAKSNRSVPYSTPRRLRTGQASVKMLPSIAENWLNGMQKLSSSNLIVVVTVDVTRLDCDVDVDVDVDVDGRRRPRMLRICGR